MESQALGGLTLGGTKRQRTRKHQQGIGILDKRVILTVTRALTGERIGTPGEYISYLFTVGCSVSLTQRRTSIHRP